MYFELITKNLTIELECIHPETVKHSTRVADLAVSLGERFHLDRDEMIKLHYAARLHDIGKLYTGREILDREGPLSMDEFEKIKSHPEDGANLVMHMMQDTEIASSIYYHHERYDGDGYLRGLKGDGIPLFSRIIFVVDAYDAMVTRDYSGRMKTEHEALIELEENAGSQFDPRAVDEFLEMSQLPKWMDMPRLSEHVAFEQSQRLRALC